MNATNTVLAIGSIVISRMGLLHRVAMTNAEKNTITLRDKRTFDASEFRPYLPEFHGDLADLETCDECFTQPTQGVKRETK